MDEDQPDTDDLPDIDQFSFNGRNPPDPPDPGPQLVEVQLAKRLQGKA